MSPERYIVAEQCSTSRAAQLPITGSPGARPNGGRGLARPVVPGGASLLAVRVSTRSNVVTVATSIAMIAATAKSTTAVRWLFRSSSIAKLHSSTKRSVDRMVPRDPSAGSNVTTHSVYAGRWMRRQIGGYLTAPYARRSSIICGAVWMRSSIRTARHRAKGAEGGSNQKNDPLARREAAVDSTRSAERRRGASAVAIQAGWDGTGSDIRFARRADIGRAKGYVH